MKIKTSELTGAALDWAVAKCEGEKYSAVKTYNGIGMEFPATRYSTDWGQGGPIIERERIDVARGNDLYFPQGNESGHYYEPLWLASIGNGYQFHGRTQLEAAMRCYVASKLGDAADVPEGVTDHELL